MRSNACQMNDVNVVGMPRSGSSLIKNAINCVYKDYRVVNNSNVCRSIYTYRDPRDCVSSLLMLNRNSNLISGYDVQDASNEVFNSLVKMRSYPEHSIMKYELFWNNMTFLFCDLDRILGEQTTRDVRISAWREIRASRIENSSRISKFFGQPGHWKSVIPVRYHRLVTGKFRDDLIFLGYNE